MPTANYEVGDSFNVQFAWRLPDEDYLRAVFEAHVEDTIPVADKYIVSLTRLVAGRQESKDGEPRSTDQFAKEYWALVGEKVGRKLTLAYEADDGRALHLRLETLTGEHNYFSRFDDVQEMIRQKVQSPEDPAP